MIGGWCSPARPDGDWREQAACRGRRDVNFFPDPSDLKGLARAQLVCRGCPVKDACADHALVYQERFGVWAGVNVGIATEAALRERKRAKNDKRQERRRLIRGPMHGPDDPRHGTLHGYNLGCKCEACSEAKRINNRQRDRAAG